MRDLHQALARRALLLQRVSRQRIELVNLAQGLKRPAALVDKALALAGEIRRRPLLAAGIALVSLLILRKRQPVVRTVLTAMAVWRWWLARTGVSPAASADRRTMPARPPV